MSSNSFMQFKAAPGAKPSRRRFVSPSNPLPVSFQSEGAAAFTSVFGDAIVGSRISDVSVQFQYNNSSHDVNETTSGTGTTSNANSKAKLSTGTGVGKATISSHHSVRYRPGHEAFAYFTALFTAGESGVTQLAGLGDAVNAYTVGYNSTTFVVGLRTSSTDDFTKATFIDSLDGTGASGFTLDPTNLNIFRITYGWLGIAPIVFQIYTGFIGGWKTFAYIDLVNLQSTPSVANPTLPVFMEVNRASGSGADISMETSSWNGGTVANGGTDQAARHFAKKNSKTISATTLTNILTIQSQTTFQSKTNYVETILALLSASCDGNQIVDIELWKNATLGGTPSYAAVDSNNSIMYVDTAGTTVSAGTYIMGLELGKADGDVLDIHPQHIDFHAGDTITVAAYSGATSIVTSSLRWAEQF